MRQVIVRLAEEGRPQKRATLTYVEQLPADFWDEVAGPFLRGERRFGKAEKTLTINVIRGAEG